MLNEGWHFLPKPFVPSQLRALILGLVFQIEAPNSQISHGNVTIPRKRIAVLSPVAWRTPPRQYGAWETVAGNIAEGLVARGWDVTLFATGDSITRARLHAVVDRAMKRIAPSIPKSPSTFTSPKSSSTPLSST